jgi:uncharacterized protein involved in outer membrane biogenesis
LGIVVAVNLYVQSPTTQRRIQEEISRALRVPIEITSASVTPWGDLRIAGITVPSEGGNFLEATSFSARYEVLPLLRGKLIITKMILESPKIVWAQNSEGRWALPALPDTGEKKRAKDEAAETGKEAPKKKEDGFTVKVDGFEIRNGSIELRDTKGERVAIGGDVQMTYSFGKPERVEGTIHIGKLAWKDLLVFDDLRSPFSYHKGELRLSDLEALLGGGTVKGRLRLEPEKKDAPFDFAVDLANVDLTKVSTDAGWVAGQAAGSVNGHLNLHGSSKEAERSEGKGQLTLKDGQFKQFEFFQTLGQVLQVSELANLRLKEGSAQFRVADEKVFIESMLLEAPEIRITAAGLARFDGKLQLEAQLALSQRLSKQLPSFVKDNFGPPDEAGGRSVPFKITGRTDRPKTDLLDQLVGQRIGSQFDDLVSNIFGLKKKKDDKESKKKKRKEDDAKSEEKDKAPDKGKDQPSEPAPESVSSAQIP